METIKNIITKAKAKGVASISIRIEYGENRPYYGHDISLFTVERKNFDKVLNLIEANPHIFQMDY
ncbi:MAG: hypothetical protein IKO46_05995 [Salinivirgaceae bacterium]|nr:hypothetical protein [Salinivirgaceae bacterium]